MGLFSATRVSEVFFIVILGTESPDEKSPDEKNLVPIDVIGVRATSKSPDDLRLQQ